MFMPTIKPLLSSSDIDTSSDAPDKPPTLFISIIVFASFLFVAIVGLVAFQLPWLFIEKRQAEVDTGMANVKRLNYLKEEEEKLNSYKKLDNGLYVIPIEEAMNSLVK